MIRLEDRPDVTGIVVQGGRRWPVAECACCGQNKMIKRRGLCPGCTDRHDRRGTITEWGRSRADRIEEFRGWREAGRNVRDASMMTGVSERTGHRYERFLRLQPVPGPPRGTE